MSFPSHSGGGPSSFPMSFQQSSRSSPQPSARGNAGPDFLHSNPMFELQDNQFDLFEWYPRFQSCLRYFIDHAQHSGPVQAVAAFINIQLPYQRTQHPIISSRSSGSPSAAPSPSMRGPGGPISAPPSSAMTLTPYIRRLVATGFDYPGLLHGFFGDDWALGIGRLHEVERRNYLFAAKSGSWLEVKNHYDMDDGQTVPFLRPLQRATERELVNVESIHWSEWLAMQDWMVGPRSLDPDEERDSPHGHGVKREASAERHTSYRGVGR